MQNIFHFDQEGKTDIDFMQNYIRGISFFENGSNKNPKM